MPYIQQAIRRAIDEGATTPVNVGELNYALTKALISTRKCGSMVKKTMLNLVIVTYILDKGVSYQAINDVMGALISAGSEYIRRTKSQEFDKVLAAVIGDFYAEVAAPYEDMKIAENGDVYPQPKPLRLTGRVWAENTPTYTGEAGHA